MMLSLNFGPIQRLAYREVYLEWDPTEQEEFRTEEVKWEGGKEVQGHDSALASAAGNRCSLLPGTF